MCYGKAYTLARGEAPASEVSKYVIRGLEADIKRDGGAPVFRLVVETLTCLTGPGGLDRGAQLQARLDLLGQQFADASLTRHWTAAAERIGLDCLRRGEVLSEQRAADYLIGATAGARGCEGMTAYVARDVGGSVTAALARVGAVVDNLRGVAETRDLASRMLNASARGLPAKAVKGSKIVHQADALNNEVLA